MGKKALFKKQFSEAGMIRFPTITVYNFFLLEIECGCLTLSLLIWNSFWFSD